MGSLIHSQSNFKPKIIPYLGNVDAVEIDRAQSLDPDITLPREKIEELGRDGIVDWIKDVSVTGCRLVQREYGSIEFFRKLANVSDSTTSIDLSDFASSAFDIAVYLTDDDGNFSQTIWYPKQRLAGFSISIGDPTALIDRNFDFTGENAYIFQGDNKYLIFKTKTVSSGDLGSGNSVTITVSDPTAVQDPDTSNYILRVSRVRSGSTSDLTSGTDYSYDSNSGELTVTSCQVGDVIKYVYTASSYISGQSPFVLNDSDLGGIRANSASLYIGTSNYLYRVQSATIDVRFDREDIREIGNDEVVLRGVRNKTVTITLGKLLDTDLTLEEVLRGVSSSYGKIDFDKLSDDLTFICALYSDSTKSTFKIGYKATDLAVTSVRPGTAAIDTHVDSGVTLEGESLTITSELSDLGLS